MIFVAGVPRTGTSLTCQVLNACGLDFGSHKSIRKGHPVNRRGFWEHDRVKREVMIPLLTELGADYRMIHPMPDRRVRYDKPLRIRRRIDAALGGARVYKDSRVVLLWPILHQAYPSARWIVTRRDEDETARSMGRCWLGKLVGDDVSGYVREFNERLDDLTRSVDAVEIWPDPTDAESFRPAVEHAGLTFDAATVARVLDPTLWNGGTA